MINLRKTLVATLAAVTLIGAAAATPASAKPFPKPYWGWGLGAAALGTGLAIAAASHYDDDCYIARRAVVDFTAISSAIGTCASATDALEFRRCRRGLSLRQRQIWTHSLDTSAGLRAKARRPFDFLRPALCLDHECRQTEDPRCERRADRRRAGAGRDRSSL